MADACLVFFIEFLSRIFYKFLKNCKNKNSNKKRCFIAFYCIITTTTTTTTTITITITITTTTTIIIIDFYKCLKNCLKTAITLFSHSYIRMEQMRGKNAEKINFNRNIRAVNALL